MIQADRDTFVRLFGQVQSEVYTTAVDHGFWDGAETLPENLLKGNKLALMHSELSECLEAVRKPGVPDSHLPDCDPEAVELADTIIRIMDYAERWGIPVADAILVKGDYNEQRPYKHGKTM